VKFQCDSTYTSISISLIAKTVYVVPVTSIRVAERNMVYMTFLAALKC